MQYVQRQRLNPLVTDHEPANPKEDELFASCGDGEKIAMVNARFGNSSLPGRRSTGKLRAAKLTLDRTADSTKMAEKSK